MVATRIFFSSAALRAHSNAVNDRPPQAPAALVNPFTSMALQLHHRVVVIRFQRQVAVLGVAFQQPPSFQKPRNPVTYGMHECLDFLDVWRLYPVKTQFSMPVLNIDTVEKEHVRIRPILGSPLWRIGISVLRSAMTYERWPASMGNSYFEICELTIACIALGTNLMDSAMTELVRPGTT